MRPFLKTQYIFSVWLVATLLFSGCSNDSTSPRSEYLKLAGSWDAVSLTNAVGEHNLRPGSLYWFFDDRGEFCSKSQNALGEYGGGFCGKVSTVDMTLAEGHPDTIVRIWSLFFIGGSDTLKAELLEANVPAADSWLLVRVQSSVSADCFCDYGF